ncbi:MAG: pectate lyase [Thermodesulfobacteriota bacterium]
MHSIEQYFIMIKIHELFQLYRGKKRKDTSTDQSIEAAKEWLLRAQDATPDGGVAIRYSLINGWESSYPETTGYIIPTLLNLSNISGDVALGNRAMRMADWEISIQQEDGSFIGGSLKQPTGKLVFDTGQIIFGLLRAFEHSKDTKYLNAAVKAGDWLVAIQSDDGAWRQHVHFNIPHSYHSRVAWAIARLYETVGDAKYKNTVLKHIRWVLSNQLGNGWFEQAGFTLENHKAPYTHTIAYTIRGLLETGIILNRTDFIEAARKSANQAIKLITSQGFLWGKYDRNWERKANFSCLTGNAQFSIIFLRLFQLNKEAMYLEGAKNLNSYLRSRQIVGEDVSKNIAGAIAGSWPIWGEYERFSLPNWATKFFIDALMLEKSVRI